MQDFLIFLRDYEKLLSVIEFVSLFIFGILVYKKTGNIKFFKEVFDMKYRKEDYNVVKNVNEDGEEFFVRVSPGQKFNTIKSVYRLNKTTGLLELTEDTIDLQEQLNSYKDCELSALMDKFLPGEVQDLVVAEQHNVQDKLDFMQEAFEVAEEFKSKYGFDESLSMQEIFNLVGQKNEELKKYMEVKEIEKKENIQEGKQKNISQDGPQG